MKKLLTIIIPSYNTESFIDKNLPTMLDEEILGDIEIIIVNDGSKDNTATKASAYVEGYPDCVRLINKENGGHGSTINIGVLEACGKYFKVIDADDWVDTNNLKRLVNDLKKYDVDLVLNPYIRHHQVSQQEIQCSMLPDYMHGIVSSLEVLMELQYAIRLHSATYKTSLFINNHLRLTERCFYEDFEFCFFPLPYLKSIVYLNYPVYIYLVGQKTQSIDAQNALKNTDQYLRVYEDSVRYYNRLTGLEKNLGKYMESCLCNFLRSLYNVYIRNAGDKEIVKKLRVMDQRTKEISPYFYEEVTNRNRYIRIQRKSNRLMILLLDVLLRVYKRDN